MCKIKSKTYKENAINALGNNDCLYGALSSHPNLGKLNKLSKPNNKPNNYSKNKSNNKSNNYSNNYSNNNFNDLRSNDY